ncbi:hypothetical protein HIM_11716 [Hirsutella minnesotensis 3608]|uniref:Uncharacterized protein n=1 Tax=Hirsutella minnesotensis 3608 TaxID=1043627 RepID=A0A0F8A0V4_9HYPO|nr:hypothetical protein HIM_11716 [Hirsutella minnesotensis 3608]
MFSNSSPAHLQVPRPGVQEQNDSYVLPQRHESVKRAPVTPGITLGTYDDYPKGTGNPEQTGPLSQEYFSMLPDASSQDQAQPSPELSPDTTFHLGTTAHEHQNSSVALSRTILSATFTIPHLLQYCKGAKWELKHQYHRSAQLDSLAYLSSNQNSWGHTVIAWTGEIGHASDDASSSPDAIPAMAPSSTCISFGGHLQNHEETRADEVFINYSDKSNLEEQLYSEDMRTLPIWLANDSDITENGIRLKKQSRWRRYAEHDLCALFHYRQHPPTDGRKENSRWHDYYRMNEAFANKICDIYQPGDIVMVHDYYLMLLPKMLRQRHPGIHVLFFLESPFPTSELVRCLPRRREILEGVLGSNLIGFQSFHFAQHFANSCTRILDYPASSEGVDVPGARANIGVFPAGIDVSKITSLAYTNSVRNKCAELRKLYQGKKVIVGCDPWDRLGGVDKKLQGFGCFLERYPQWRENVVLVQLIGPATIEDNDGDESKYASKVSELASSVNRTYGSLGFTPIQMHAHHLSQDEYFALLRLGDAALNTCVREGMSTVSLEYIICQRDTHGALILSEFSGTASSLEEAIQVNPWDVTEMADQINKALTMTMARRRHLHKTLHRRVSEGNVEFWVNSILQRLVQGIAGQNGA